MKRIRLTSKMKYLLKSIKFRFIFTDSNSYSRLKINKELLIEFNKEFPSLIKSVNELRYWLIHYKDKRFIENQYCVECGKRTLYDRHGYYLKYCCRECMDKSEIKVQEYKKTCKKKYGLSSFVETTQFKKKSRKTKLNKYGNPTFTNRDKAKQTFISNYGVDNPMKSRKIKNKLKNTMLEYYGVENPMYSEVCKNNLRKTCIERYGVDNPSKCKFVTDKIYNTKKEKGSFKGNTSSEELKVYNIFKRHFKVERFYKSKEYPFNCDFYLPKFKLYIEYQGYWTHGNFGYKSKWVGPYTKSSFHKEVLKYLNKKYKNSYEVEVWTLKDPLKRKIAKKNNIRFIEFWSIEEVVNWCSKFKTFDKFSRNMIGN